MSQISYCKNTTIADLLCSLCFWIKRKPDWSAVCLQRFVSASCGVADSPLIAVVLLEANANPGSRSIHKSVSLMLAKNKGHIGDPLKSNPLQIWPVRPSLLNFEIISCVFWPSGEPRFTFDVYSGCQRLTVEGVRLTGGYLLRKERWLLAHSWRSELMHTPSFVKIHSSSREPSVDCFTEAVKKRIAEVYKTNFSRSCLYDCFVWSFM